MTRGRARLLLAALILLFGAAGVGTPGSSAAAGPVGNTEGGSTAGEAFLAEDGYVRYDELTVDATYPGDGSSPYRYNPSGEDIVVDRTSTGRYVVTLSAVAFEFIPTVTAYGTSDVHCNIAAWTYPGTFATVRCFDSAGVITDSAFTMRWTSTVEDAALYVRINGSVCCGPNPWGATPTGIKNGTGDYTVTVPGAPNFEKGHVQVTAQGVTTNHCKVKSVGNTDARILCFDPAGNPADSAFAFLRVGSQDDAYLWADDPDALVPYTTSTSFSHNPQGIDPTSVQTALGSYTVTFPDHLVDFGGSVAVTAYGDGPERCKVAGWTDTEAQVLCVDSSGAAAASQFNLLFTRFRTCNGLPANVEIGNEVPTTGDDVIIGTAGDDTISALNGDDVVCAGDGNDFVIGSGGSDTIFGEGGDDTVSGNAGDDVLDGGDGNDMVFAGSGNDVVTGGIGDDLLGGSSGVDQIAGEDGNDTMTGGSGDDGTISGGAGNDAVNGGAGNDIDVSGDDGDDTVSGNGGDDIITGAAGNDAVRGGNGADLVYGGDGDDFVAGNDGVDTCDGEAGIDTAAVNCETVLGVP